MKAFEARFDIIVGRFYLMMLIVIVPFFLGVPLLALFALPMFLISILGISFKKEETKDVNNTKTGKRRKLFVTQYDQALNEAS